MKKMFFFVLLLLVNFRISAEEEGDSDSVQLIDLKGLPSSSIDGCVNVITGNFTPYAIDLVVPGSNPINLSRSFNSRSPKSGDICDAWTTNFGGKVSMVSYQGQKQAVMTHGGSSYAFHGNKFHKHFDFDKKQLKYGVTNCHSGFISAKNNLKNIKFISRHDSRYCYGNLSNHETLTFYSHDKDRSEQADFLLKEHALPNGCHYEYTYDKHDRIKDIFSVDNSGNHLSSLHFNYPKNSLEIEIQSSDGRSVKYLRQEMKRGDFLSEIISDHLPHQKFEYHSEKHYKYERLSRCTLPDGRYKEIDYYKMGTNYVCNQKIAIKYTDDERWGSVAAISGPVGTDETPIRMYSFLYDVNKKKHQEGSTTVFDAKNNKSVYRYSDDNRLTSIENFLEDGSLYRREEIEWGKKHTNDYINLKKRSISSGDSEVFSREYIYDKKGNVIEEIVKGVSDSYSKKYSYNDYDQLVREDDGFKIINYSYVPETDLPKKKLVISENKIKERYYLEYDESGAITKEIVDDGDRKDISDLHGVTFKYIRYISPTKTMPIGLPEIIDEKIFDTQSKQELLVKRTINSYSKYGQLIRQQQFDQDLNFTFDLEWDYDIKGNLIWQKDAVGRITEFRYDANNNRIFQQGPDKRFYHEFVYDFSNRLIRVEKIHEDGNRLVETYSYDYCGNKVSSTDCFGHTTHYVYDSLNRLIETIYPAIIRQDDTVLVPTEKLQYDVLNNIISKTDRNGNETKMSYSFHSKPISVEYADCGKEKFIYRPDGLPLKVIKPNGASIEYSYDYKNRKISERFYDINGDFKSEQKWNYSAFKLLSETDRSGVITYYSYDSRGRLSKKVRGEEESLYFYDARGRKIETWDKYAEGKYRKMTCVYDDLDQIIEETIQDQDSQLFSHKLYEYDINGNKTTASVVSSNSIATKHTEYDANNQPIKIVEPSGEITHFFRNYSYIDAKGQSVLYEEIIDPMGTVTAKTYDPHGKVALEEIKSSYGELLIRTSYCFDGCGKLVSRYDDHIVHGICEKTILTSFEYDSRGNEIAIIEAEQKITRKQYGKMGEVIRLIKPDGVNIHYTYDYAGRLLDVRDDIGQIHYLYTYDLNDNVVKVQDIIHHTETLRTFDENNRLKEEILDNGLKIGYQHDALGRVIKKIFPDETSVDYDYNAKNLKTVTRGSVHFSYDYDLSGRLTKIVTPIGQQNFRYDQALRIIGIETPFYSQTMTLDSYDPSGRLQKYTHSDAVGTIDHQFGYDSLNQIISEEGDFNHNYGYDSRFNRTQKDEAVYENNDLNQLLSQNTSYYDYDKNGNRQTIIKAGQTINCTYDSLNRLISVTDNCNQVTFQYDSFNRRIQKSVSTLSNDPIYTEKYLYEGDDEIGSVDECNKIKELKIQGPGSLKSAALIEIGSEKFIPIHNHRGDIVTLVNANTSSIVATYRYSSFGEEKIYTPTIVNPWRFSGKRVDAETGWNFIGHRYYDSEVGRWITPDPLWFADGPNLYAYVHNSPIIFVDPTGLYHSGFADFLKGQDFEDVANGINNLFRAFIGQEPEYNKSRVHIIEGKDNNDLTTTLINGIGNSFEDAVKSAEYLSKMAGGIRVILVYNASHGFFFDTFETIINYCGISTAPAILLQNEFNSASERMGENGTILHFGHSQGCVLSKLSFRGVDESIQKQIIATLIAPAEFFNDDTLKSVEHIGSWGDAVSRFDFIGRWNCTTYSEYKRSPNENGYFLDHRFESETFYEPLMNRINQQMKNLGCFQ